MSQIGFQLTSDKGRVATIAIFCTHADGQVDGLDFGFGSRDLDGCHNLNVGCEPEEGIRYQNCPQESLVGLRVNSGQDVNAIGLICDRRDPPAPTPVKAVKSTGRAPTANSAQATPTGPPLALRQSVSGPWKVVFGGETYLFQIYAQSQGIGPFGRDDLPIVISGTIASDGLTGGMGGSMQADRQLLVQYGINGGPEGTCSLLYSPDGKQLVGTCGTGGTSVRASGSRVSAANVSAATAGNAVPQPTAAPAPAAGARAVTVAQSVDLYAAAGGNGDATGSLEAGTAGVTLVEPCQGDWCHVKWAGHEGWVYNGADYRSLSF
jgi:hypothetical protein